jgi:Flp pilus assembly protein TadD
MLLNGWTSNALRVLLLTLVAAVLEACATPGGFADEGRLADPSAAADAGPEAAVSPEIAGRYAALLVRLRDGEPTAVADLEKFSAEYPGFAGPLLNLGLVRARAGDEAGAIAQFEKAAAVCSHCGAVWNELGVLHARFGRFADAEDAYQRAIELEPGFAAAYYNLGILYELYVPRPELAVQNYEQYLQLGADDDGQDVQKWVAELRRRSGAVPTAARAEGSE